MSPTESGVAARNKTEMIAWETRRILPGERQTGAD